MSNYHFSTLWRGLLSAALALSSATAWADSPVGAARLSAQDRAALDADEQIEVIVEFDQSAVEASAQALRRQSSLSHDNAEILAERVQSYRQQKDQVFTALANAPVTLKRNFSHLPMAVVQMRSPAAMQALLAQPGVKAVHSNLQRKSMLTRSLPLIAQPQTAAQGGTGAGTTVAVLDTGVDYTRPAFGSCSAAGAPGCKVIVAPKEYDPDQDESKHGTNVAGIVLGVAPEVKIADLNVFEGKNASADDIIGAINWAIANKAKYNIAAMNLSLGGEESYATHCADHPESTPIANARAAGILAAIASGNETSKHGIGSPACAPAAVSVGAVYSANFVNGNWGDCVDRYISADTVTCFSNSAAILTLLAPGAYITAADETMGGTSQAAPHVAGALAVLRAAYPNESVDATVARLVKTGVPVTDRANGITKPRIDLFKAYSSGTPQPNPQPNGSKLISISTRGKVGTGDDVLFAEFVIAGAEPKRVLMTAKGPSLAASGVSGVLANPTLALYNAKGEQIDFNDNWGYAPNTKEIAAIATHPSNPLEAAILTTLQPGTYMAIVRGYNNTTGNGQFAVYDAGVTANVRLSNASTRGKVGAGNDVLFAEFVIEGTEPKRVLMTAKGPSLAANGISGVLANPTLALYNAKGQQIDFNDNWGYAPNTQEIAATGTHPSNPLEAAILTTLQPGTYMAIVRGYNNMTGIGQFGLYDLNPQ